MLRHLRIFLSAYSEQLMGVHFLRDIPARSETTSTFWGPPPSSRFHQLSQTARIINRLSHTTLSVLNKKRGHAQFSRSVAFYGILPRIFILLMK
jgi:hypothetical protein